MSILNLDRDQVDECRFLAEKIGRRIQEFVDRHTTHSIERATLRLFGVNESHRGRPLVNGLLEGLSQEQIGQGVCLWFGRALARHRGDPVAVALRLAEGRIRWSDLESVPKEDAERALAPLVARALRQLESLAQEKRQLLSSVPQQVPLKYLIVATGNIHEDVVQARAAVLAGADCIAVIRSTAQSLLDHVPAGVTTEGFGGTYATQENFRIMREAMDEVGKEVGRHIRVVNYSSGLCMPEIAVLGALERLDYLLNDSMYGILFRDINMKRTFCDQYFSRLVIARAGLIINTGEDNYLTTAESFRAFPQVLASQFINEQLAKQAHLREEQIGLGHAFEMDPQIEDSLLYEIAQAQMVREIFYKHPIKYMPPTRHKNGDLFFGHVLDSFFNLVGVLTGQQIQLLGMATEGIHNPLLQDRAMSLKSASYVFRAAQSLGDEISWSPNGKVVRRARTVLMDTQILLQKVERVGLMKAIELGYFADIARAEDGGRGLDGLIRRASNYWNPVLQALEREVVESSAPEARYSRPRRPTSGHPTSGRPTSGRPTSGRPASRHAPRHRPVSPSAGQGTSVPPDAELVETPPLQIESPVVESQAVAPEAGHPETTGRPETGRPPHRRRRRRRGRGRGGPRGPGSPSGAATPQTTPEAAAS